MLPDFLQMPTRNCIITDELKMYYYRGRHEWKSLPDYLTDSCLTAQDHYKAPFDYFKIKYLPSPARSSITAAGCRAG